MMQVQQKPVLKKCFCRKSLQDMKELMNREKKAALVIDSMVAEGEDMKEVRQERLKYFRGI